MSDGRLRDLERRFRSTGTTVDEAAWLAERVRVGELPAGRVELAALLGSEAARTILGAGPPPKPWKAWLERAVRTTWPPNHAWAALPTGWEVAVRATVALARAIDAPRVETRMGWVPERERDQATQALEAAEAWAACPCREHAIAAHEVLHPGLVDARNHVQAVQIYAGAAKVASTQGGCDVHPGCDRVVRNMLATCTKAAKLVGAARTRPVVEAEVLPWALGLGDPLLARVRGRAPPS